ncbi:MAG: recombination regulator RecX [Bacillales bacterium]|nr:recombination regulator RecX [Bacillales bacterium]
MKVITKISVQQNNKERYNVFLNGAFAFSVDEAVLARFRLKKGMELEKEDIAEILYADEVRKGYQDSVYYLAKRMRTEKEIREFLRKKEYGSEVIDLVIQKLYEQQYLDDRDFAKAYVQTQIKTTDKGPIVVAEELAQKGVDKSIVEQALELYGKEEQVYKAKKLTEKVFHRNLKESFLQNKQKAIQLLRRKGFSGEVISEALANAMKKDEENEKEALFYQAEKAFRRYRSASGNERLRKVQQFLYRKGFSMEDIQQAVERLKE